jgi:hypothetical protein
MLRNCRVTILSIMPSFIPEMEGLSLNIRTALLL